jgi:hypothetical protein
VEVLPAIKDVMSSRIDKTNMYQCGMRMMYACSVVVIQKLGKQIMRALCLHTSSKNVCSQCITMKRLSSILAPYQHELHFQMNL